MHARMMAIGKRASATGPKMTDLTATMLFSTCSKYNIANLVYCLLFTVYSFMKMTTNKAKSLSVPSIDSARSISISRWLIGGVALLLWTLIVLIIAYQTATSKQIIMGDYYDPPFLHGSFSDAETTQETQRSFRWTTGEAQVSIPSAGRGTWTTRINLLTAHPDQSPVNAALQFDQHTGLQLPDSSEPRVIHAIIPASANNGDVGFTLVSNLYPEPTASARTLGVALFNVSFASTNTQTWLPPWQSVLWLGLIALGIALSLILTRLDPRIALGIAAAMIAGLAMAIMFRRVPNTLWLPGLAFLSWLSVLLVWGLRSIVPWLMAKGGVELEQSTLTMLLLIFLAGFWIKGGGQLYPYMIAIDIHWHMERVRWILDGRLGEIYKPGAFNESVMPEKEFGANRPTIPYSPFFHIFATSFALLPFQMEQTAKIFSSIQDNCYPLLIYFFARSFGFSRRSGLLAAGLYSVIPLTYLLHSWGNVPTTNGMWWTFMTIAFIIGAWGTLNLQKRWWIFVGILTITFLMYTVMAVFLGMLLVLWMSYIAISRRDQRGEAWRVIKAMFMAVGFATLIYYGLYIPDIVRKTIPYFSTSLTKGQEAVGAVQYQATNYDNFRAYGIRLINHGLLIPLFLSPLGVWLMGRWRTQRPDGKLWLGSLWMCAMFSVSLIFFWIDRNVPMVDKHIIFLIPVWCLLIAVMLDETLKRWRWTSILAASAYLVLFAMSIELWLRRISAVKQVW